MEKVPQSEFINLEQLIKISRGNQEKMDNYLRQFVELIPTRIEILKEAIKKEDRVGVRKILHNMSPQIQFFGIRDIGLYITRIEFEYQKMKMNEMIQMVEDIIEKLNKALIEVKEMLID